MNQSKDQQPQKPNFQNSLQQPCFLVPPIYDPNQQLALFAQQQQQFPQNTMSLEQFQKYQQQFGNAMALQQMKVMLGQNPQGFHQNMFRTPDQISGFQQQQMNQDKKPYRNRGYSQSQSQERFNPGYFKNQNQSHMFNPMNLRSKNVLHDKINEMEQYQQKQSANTHSQNSSHKKKLLQTYDEISSDQSRSKHQNRQDKSMERSMSSQSNERNTSFSGRDAKIQRKSQLKSLSQSRSKSLSGSRSRQVSSKSKSQSQNRQSSHTPYVNSQYSSQKSLQQQYINKSKNYRTENRRQSKYINEKYEKRQSQYKHYQQRSYKSKREIIQKSDRRVSRGRDSQFQNKFDSNHFKHRKDSQKQKRSRSRYSKVRRDSRDLIKFSQDAGSAFVNTREPKERKTFEEYLKNRDSEPPKRLSPLKVRNFEAPIKESKSKQNLTNIDYLKAKDSKTKKYSDQHQANRKFNNFDNPEKQTQKWSFSYDISPRNKDHFEKQMKSHLKQTLGSHISPQILQDDSTNTQNHRSLSRSKRNTPKKYPRNQCNRDSKPHRDYKTFKTYQDEKRNSQNKYKESAQAKESSNVPSNVKVSIQNKIKQNINIQSKSIYPNQRDDNNNQGSKNQDKEAKQQTNQSFNQNQVNSQQKEVKRLNLRDVLNELKSKDNKN